MVLGDLYVMEGICDAVLRWRLWPDRVDLALQVAGMTGAWREHHAAFARGVAAWEWALVDGVYNNLGRTIPDHTPGQPCDASDITSLEALKGTIPRARTIVLERAAKPRERDGLVKQLAKDHDSP